MLASVDMANLKLLGNAVGINLYLEKPVNCEALIDAIVSESVKTVDKIFPVSSNLNVPNFNALHILLVEDNSINRKVALAYLKDTQTKVSVVGNGKLAIEKLTQDTSINVVLMDIQMPVMDGFTATNIIRNDLKLTLPIIAMTAHVMINEVNKCFEIGMNAHVSKPIDPNLLYQAIQKTYQTPDSMPLLPNNNVNTNLPLSNFYESLIIIDRSKAINALLNDEAAYQDLVDDFISMYQLNEIPDKVDSLENLSLTQQVVHAIKPALSYIGVYNLAEFALDLEQELKQFPLDPIQENKIHLFKSSLDKIVNKLKNTA